MAKRPSNPYLNRYRRELQREEDNRQKILSGRSRRRFFAGLAIGVGTVFAINEFHPRGLIGALDDVSRYTRSYVSAAHDTFNRYIAGAGDGISKAISLSENIAKTIENRESAIRYFKERAERHMSAINELYIDRLRIQTDELSKGFNRHLRRSRVHGRAMSLLDEALSNEEYSAEVRSAIQEFQKRFHHRIADMAITGNKGKIAVHLENIGIKDQRATDIIFNALSHATKNLDMSDAEVLRADFTQRLMESIVERRQASGGFFQETMLNLLGYRRATVHDLLTLPGIEISEEAREFLTKLRDVYGADFSKFIPDDYILVHRGKLVTGHNFKNLGRSLRSGFSDGILGRIAYQRDYILTQQYAERAGTFIRAGYHVPTLQGTGVVDDRGILMEGLVHIGDRIYRLEDMGKPIAEGYHLASGRYGSTRKFISSMSGVNAPDWSDSHFWNWLFDIGGDNREPSAFKKFRSIFGKDKDPDYFPNRVMLEGVFKSRLIQEYAGLAASDKEIPRLSSKIIKDIHDFISNQARPFSNEIIEELASRIRDESLGRFAFDTTEDLIQSYVKLVQAYIKPTGNIPDEEVLRETAYRILGDSRVVKRYGVFARNRFLTGEDLLKKEISKKLVILNDIDATLEILEGMKKAGRLSERELIEAQKTVADAIFSEVFSGRTGNINYAAAAEILSGNRYPVVLNALGDMLNVAYPKFGYGNFGDFIDYFKGDVIPIKKFQANRLEDWFAIFTGGRNNMQDVHRGTLAVYGLLNRINELVKDFDYLPLALSDDSMGSPLDIIFSIMFKRVIPIYLGAETLKYINDYWSDLTGSGYTFMQQKERGQAAVTLGIARAKDALHITDFFKFLDRVTPGNEGLKTTFSHLPIFGPTAPISFAATFFNSIGLFSSRSYEEWIDYYTSGEDPIRKGRYWFLGSTPWMGERIQYFEPSRYRQVMAQWHYTDTVYGSKEMYWSHSFLPTPSYPLAPVRRFITDRYWFEKMHAKDRPYPLTGEMFDPNTPWGPVLNTTIGRILKPQFRLVRGASREDLRRIEEENAMAMNVITRVRGGDLQLATYIPGYSMARNVGIGFYGSPYGIPMPAGKTLIIGVQGEGGGGIPVGMPIDVGNLTTEEVAILQAQMQGYIGDGALRLGSDLESSGLVVGGRNYSLREIEDINRAIIQKSGQINFIRKKSILNTGFVIPYYEEEEVGELDIDIKDPRGVSYNLERTFDMLKDLSGVRGFLLGMAFGGDDYGEGSAVIATAADAYSTSSRFWRMNLGGRGGEVSEVVRRFLNKRPGLYKVINDMPNVMPAWLPEQFRYGDPYIQIPGGEIRLPGEAYESLHKLHPDEFGLYGAVDRAAILADVAPYSPEFRFWLQVARSKKLTEEEKEFLNQALEQRKQQTKRYHITPYRFLGQKVERKRVVVDKFLDSGRFMVRGSGEVYRLAGVRPTFNPETEEGLATLTTLQETMMPGMEVTIITPKDKPASGSIPAVVFSGDSNINRLLLQRGVKPREESSGIDNYIDLGPLGRTIGKAWELFAHTQIPIVHKKFINVYSPMEHYRDKQVYGKEWQSWEEPIDDYLVPTFQSAAAKHPLGATAVGMVAGYIIGLLLGGPNVRSVMSTIGGIAGGAGSLSRIGYEMTTGKAWIPKRREKERELMEYYDLLKYVKSERLFRQYARLAAMIEKTDVNEIIEEATRIDNELRKKQKRLERLAENIAKFGLRKKDTVKTIVNREGRLEHLLVTEKEYLKEVRKRIMAEVNESKLEEMLVGLGPYARRAIYYRQQARSTLYGLDETSTMQQIYAAFPSRDREYLEYFSQVTDPEERKEILKIVPDNQKTAYRILWGMGDTERESLAEMFRKYYLPDKDWVGWQEGVSLEDAMIKLIENEGLDPKDFGLWKDFTVDEKLTPAPVPANRRFDRPSTKTIKNRLYQVLEGFDLRNIDIRIQLRDDNQINVGLDVVHDVRNEVRTGIIRALGG